MVHHSTLYVVLVCAGPSMLLANDGAAGPAGERSGTSCVTGTCHSRFHNRRFLHRPAAERRCEDCHRARVSPRGGAAEPGECIAEWELARPASVLCTSCHPFVQKNYVHEPVAGGNCTGCHDPHGAENAHLLRDDPATGLCFSCHERAAFGPSEHGHDPARSGACILCHDAHSSWRPKLLADAAPRLCLSCHEDVLEEASERRHVHQPVLEDCGGCHDPHGSGAAKLLREPVRELCLGCHEKTRLLVETSDHVHGALESERSCLACHSAHASDFRALVRRPVMDACLECHDRPLELPGGRTLADMARLLADNPEHHGPVRRADCSSCHEPHASPNFRLLRKAYPQDFYLQEFDLESYDLCFQCHFKELVLAREGSGVTRFQHGSTNLHFSHVNREKSRTCRACHAVHASRNPAHLVDTFTFGEWTEAPLGFRQLSGGGSCAPACHREVTYTRGSPEPVPVVK